jgi:hypothetical protein
VRAHSRIGYDEEITGLNDRTIPSLRRGSRWWMRIAAVLFVVVVLGALHTYEQVRWGVTIAYRDERIKALERANERLAGDVGFLCHVVPAVSRRLTAEELARRVSEIAGSRTVEHGDSSVTAGSIRFVIGGEGVEAVQNMTLPSK